MGVESDVYDFRMGLEFATVAEQEPDSPVLCCFGAVACGDVVHNDGIAGNSPKEMPDRMRIAPCVLHVEFAAVACGAFCDGIY